MACCHHYALAEGCDAAFAVDAAAIVFGRGTLAEAGDHAAALGLKRVALYTDPGVAETPFPGTVADSLRRAGIDVAVYDAVRVEPTDVSFEAAARFAAEGRFDGFVSVGGGSVIDTCKAANLYSTHPADLLAYVNAPIGEGRPVPGPLRPHIACPTTSGTGSECTGMAVVDLTRIHAKTAIASRFIRPTLAIVDPDTTRTLPSTVVAASGFDTLCHALESWTALPHTQRPRAGRPSQRPLSQGANPWSDVGCEKALKLTGKYLVRAVRDVADREAREQMMYAAALAGIAFGNSGVHLPHGMSYAVAGHVKDFRVPGYPDERPLVPHGMAVVVNAPSVFRFTSSASPERHLEAALWMGGDARGAGPEDAGEVMAKRVIELMRATGIPNGIGGVGYSTSDLGALAESALLQQRLVRNAPRPVGNEDMRGLFEGALAYW